MKLKPCYTLRGKTAIHVNPSSYQDAVFTQEGLAKAREFFTEQIQLHRGVGGKRKKLHKRLHGFRWATGGDILNPDTGEVWEELVEVILNWIHICIDEGIPFIGYTATWEDPKSQVLRTYFLASCQSHEQAARAAALGWRVALGIPKHDDPAPHRQFLKELTGSRNAVVCPEQVGKVSSCHDCGLCANIDPELIKAVEGTDYMRYRRASFYISPVNHIIFINH
jgi:hypothetical protein